MTRQVITATRLKAKRLNITIPEYITHCVMKDLGYSKDDIIRIRRRCYGKKRYESR